MNTEREKDLEAWLEAEVRERMMAEAADEIERLQADAARLDWLAEKARTGMSFTNGEHPWDLRVFSLRGSTFRDALDAAMKADQPPNADYTQSDV